MLETRILIFYDQGSKIPLVLSYLRVKIEEDDLNFPTGSPAGRLDFSRGKSIVYLDLKFVRIRQILIERICIFYTINLMTRS